jgi:16S rRNA G966 N2-methylase RsmD
VAQGSQIYLEQSARAPLVNGVDAFEILKDKKAGDVRYLLLEVK